LLLPLVQAQKQAATPYVVLSGTVKPGQSRDAVSGGLPCTFQLLASLLWLAPLVPLSCF
jgi:hypothetical protein